MTIKKIIFLIESIKNPYPEDIFPDVPITSTNFEIRRDAMFGSFGRRVWNNCKRDIIDLLKEEK